MKTKNKAISLLLSLVMLISICVPGTLATEGDGTATVTVNYIYSSNNAMVAQPWSAQIPTGQEFNQSVAIPEIANYSVDTDASLLPNGVSLSGNTLTFAVTQVTGDITVNLYYVAGTANYTVNHWQQNVADDGYTKVLGATLEGSIDAYTSAVENAYDGFTCVGVSQSIIAADGTTQVDIYYDRNYYLVTFDSDGGIGGPDPIYGKYESEYDTGSMAAPTKAGYNFTGWDVSPTGKISGNVTYTAQWELASPNSNVAVVFWGENANDEEYSYVSSAAISAGVGNTISWGSSALICNLEEHTHTDECLICGLTEHTHSANCCTVTEHTHTYSCYSGTTGGTAGRNAREYLNRNYPNAVNGDVKSRTVSSWPFGSTTTYYLYLNETWYDAQENTALTCTTTEHTHDDENCEYCDLAVHTHDENCVTCGKTEHTHTDECYLNITNPMASNLWTYSHSDTVTVAADGSTVMNVYFDRTEFTLTFRDGNRTVKTLTEKWGANIQTHWPVVGTNGTTYNSGERWDPNGSSTYSEVLVYIAIMPAESFRLDCDRASGNPLYTMNYNVEVLPGGTGTAYQGRTFTTLFTVTARYNFVTEAEDFFPLEGFTKWTSDPEFGNNGQIDNDWNGYATVNFYYTRNSYNLYYHNGNNATAEHTKSVPFEANLGNYSYTPTDRPANVEPDATFAGWYLNPECTGAEYVLSEHTMAANDLRLYAKWVNESYDVTTYTDDTLQTLYTYEGYSGSQTVEKYQFATEPTAPTSDTAGFVGWFYMEDDVEKAFNFSMAITKDYNLYPKWSTTMMVDYVVHYYIENTTTKLAEDKEAQALIGTNVTEKALMGDELTLAEEGKLYFPQLTSTSITLKGSENVIIFYYTEATDMTYTVKYQDEDGNDLIDSVEKTTSLSIVTEQYVAIDGWTPRQFQQSLELTANEENNVIIFVYDCATFDLTITKSGAQDIDENQSFVFTVTGTDTKTSGINMTVVINGNGSVTITQLPIGAYTVTEDTGWSWRYTPDASTKSVTAENVSDGSHTLTFTNTRTADNSTANNGWKWLNGCAYVKNKFGESAVN